MGTDQLRQTVDRFCEIFGFDKDQTITRQKIPEIWVDRYCWQKIFTLDGGHDVVLTADQCVGDDEVKGDIVYRGTRLGGGYIDVVYDTVVSDDPIIAADTPLNTVRQQAKETVEPVTSFRPESG